MNLKSLLTILTVSALAPVTGEAKTMKIPDTSPTVATVEIPDNWNPEVIDGGVKSEDDESVGTLTVLAADKKKDAEADLADTYTSLTFNAVTIDQASKKVSKINVHGIEAEEMQFQGTRGVPTNFPTFVIIVRIPIKDKVVVLLAYGSTRGAAKVKGVVDKIVQSLKPATAS